METIMAKQDTFKVSSRSHEGFTVQHNRVPETVNVDTMRAYVPTFRRLGMLYHRDEPNSELKRAEMEALAGAMGFELVAVELPLAANGHPLGLE